MARIAIKPRIHEGDAGCLAEIDEFGIKVSAANRVGALYSLGRLLETHCKVLPNRPEVAVPDEIRQLAADVLKYGFVFVDVEINYKELAGLLEKVPHIGFANGVPCYLSDHPNDYGFNDFCRRYYGRCYFKERIAKLKAMATTTTT